jgi:hypothetical protein
MLRLTARAALNVAVTRMNALNAATGCRQQNFIVPVFVVVFKSEGM